MVQVGARLSAGPLAALCVPEFPAPTLAWLQGLRAKHDAKYFHLVAPHVTVVFPTATLAQAPFVAHVVSCLRGMPRGEVEFSTAAAVRDEESGLHLVCLLAGAGAELFLQLHDKLYSGPLAPEKRPDFPYAPHITLGRFASPAEAAHLTKQINAARRTIGGRVTALDIVSVSENLVHTVHSELFD
jgi:2'-5' RNA ligase